MQPPIREKDSSKTTHNTADSVVVEQHITSNPNSLYQADSSKTNQQFDTLKVENNVQKDSLIQEIKVDVPAVKKDSLKMTQVKIEKHYPVIKKQSDSAKIDSLTNLFYKGYEINMPIYSLSDLKTVSNKTTLKPIVKHRETTYTGKLRNSLYPDWFVFIFILSVLLIGLVKYFQSNKIKFLFKSFFNFNLIEQYYKDTEKVVSYTDTLLWINYILSFTMLLLIPLTHFHIFNDFSISKINLFPILLISIFVYHSLKFLITYITGIIFKQKILVREFILNSSFLHQVVGIVLIPANVLFFFYDYGNPYFIYFNMALLIISYLWLLIKGIILSRRKNIQYIYIFVYLCSLEILPLAIILKLLS